MNCKLSKITLALIFIIAASACSSDSAKENSQASKPTLTIPTDIDIIVGIGKIEPLEGIVNLASETGGIIQSVHKKAGDSVKKGETIITLRQKEERLKVQQITAQINTQKQQIQSDKLAARQVKTQLEDKIDKLTISTKLATKGAETRENVKALQADKKILKIKLSERKNKVDISQSKLKELQSQWQTAKHALSKKTIKAPADGVILNITAKVGGAIQPLQSFATFAPNGPWIVSGEADEMFAHRLKIGQQVSIHYIGHHKIITSGKIIELSPDLSNKSLFTDEPGEQQDRRVRHFKVLLDSTDHLLINSKVECNIHIK